MVNKEERRRQRNIKRMERERRRKEQIGLRTDDAVLSEYTNLLLLKRKRKIKK